VSEQEREFPDGKVCRICGSKKYTEVHEPPSLHDVKGPFASKPAIGYACADCTTYFFKPDKYPGKPEVKHFVDIRLGPPQR